MKYNEVKLWTALITPLTPGLKVDYRSLETLIRDQKKAGNGLLILGSTAEALNIDRETKEDIINFVMDLNIDVPIMAGIGGHDISEQKNWISFLETKDIDCYLMVTPIYAKPGTNSQTHWFTALMDQSSRPVMLYNVPGRSGISLSIDAVKSLMGHKNFWAIKEASGSLSSFKEYASICKNLFCGDDSLMSDFSKFGAKGLVSVASNVWPAETNKYVDLCLSQTLENKELWTTACESLFWASNPIPVKSLLWKEGKIDHPTMMPPLHETDLKNLDMIRTHSNQIKAWYKGIS